MDEDAIRFGIIGAVRRGGSFAGGLQANPAAAIAALCDVAEEELARSAARLGVRADLHRRGGHARLRAHRRRGDRHADAVPRPPGDHGPRARHPRPQRGDRGRVPGGVRGPRARRPAQQRGLHDGGELHLHEAERPRPRDCPPRPVRRALLRRGGLHPRAQAAQRDHPVAAALADRRQRLHLSHPQPGTGAAVVRTAPGGVGLRSRERPPLPRPARRPVRDGGLRHHDVPPVERRSRPHPGSTCSPTGRTT